MKQHRDAFLLAGQTLQESLKDSMADKRESMSGDNHWTIVSKENLTS